ncbi:MAG: hypothetical protein A2268_06505 [Candidatus Raymondbacteria bacterium RifOxyA12_full_50_37]|uniref:DUF362 domain-containing protein n=1 Tax=Candidatus Raymondbacteria bacterium RIFOXYD12_FULL_49_13 TaxID=1817890 RepID=A0A1F7EZG2_UNCRA|nr:MAG: hypothetical protein A2268_06505 [Candidatus Raymondbacteria bacterium RifOxyA12_full_50_37]OGJ92660.1 MAG: hypothetical protein A2350_03920 [Candidatus Raymondbacteria bacterium RifOxyB12_full_50_8]OGJ94462.1 MAG: hypothetical protein A2248_15435 [Candidatus Raymondbacteria bacterium RIFOXYA2_FULL_49_16]OGJ99218.1 MAG: hypothetical protein A2453_07285 [Candidatus Raymondbacteria bacterium RIFOXYC2_FULL_50_21]OGJ99774.1 MAG: hypothetical protein A2519_12575 [Candidatus Raymondbacteria b
MRSLSRREFVKVSATAAAAAATLPIHAAPTAAPAFSKLNQWPGRCVVNFNKGAATAMVANEKTIGAMVNESIALLTGKKKTSAAWASLFPKITQTTKIAIKVNILNNEVPSNPMLVKSIVAGLKQMEIEGKNFPASNIFIYDANNQNSLESAGFTAEDFPGITLRHHGRDFKDFGDGSHGNQPYTETMKECDYLINVPGLRGHGAAAGRVTLGFKSHYGTYPALYHDAEKMPGYLADMNCTGPVYNKTVLTVFSAIIGLKQGHGPKGSPDSYETYVKTIDPSSTSPNPSTIIMSTDPIAAEFQAIKIMRIRDNEPYTINSLPAYLKGSAGIQGALATTYNIGILDETKMDIIKVINGEKV